MPIMFLSRSKSRLSPPRRLATLLAFALVVACGPPPEPHTGKTDFTEEVKFTVPKVRAVETGTETQTKGNLIVAVVPVPFRVNDTPTKDCQRGPEQSKGLLDNFIHTNSGGVTKKPYVVITRTGVDFAPKTLTFQIKVTNHTEHVLKLEGAYPKLNINSEDVMLADTDTAKFHAAVLLPNESHSFQLAAGDWSHNQDDQIVTFTLADMPTEIDKAGNVAHKEIFSWTFKAGLEVKTANSTRTTENVLLDRGEAMSAHCPP